MRVLGRNDSEKMRRLARKLNRVDYSIVDFGNLVRPDRPNSIVFRQQENTSNKAAMICWMKFCEEFVQLAHRFAATKTPYRADDWQDIVSLEIEDLFDLMDLDDLTQEYFLLKRQGYIEHFDNLLIFDPPSQGQPAVFPDGILTDLEQDEDEDEEDREDATEEEGEVAADAGKTEEEADEEEEDFTMPSPCGSPDPEPEANELAIQRMNQWEWPTKSTAGEVRDRDDFYGVDPLE